MQLWLGQALSAAGRRGEALKLMDALKAHPDRDVRKVAKELLFIMKAPPLQLGEESRVSFDMDEFDAEKSYERAPDGTIRRRDAAAFEKPPEHFCRVDIPRRRVAAPPRPRRGHSAETGSRRRRDVDIPRRPARAPQVRLRGVGTSTAAVDGGGDDRGRRPRRRGFVVCDRRGLARVLSGMTAQMWSLINCS